VGARDLLRRLDRRVLPPLGDALYRMGNGPGRLRLLLVAGFVIGSLVLIAAVRAGDRTPVGDDTVGDVVSVGVPQGQSIPAYVAASRAELAALAARTQSPDETYALVTLSAYLAPDRLAPVVGDVAVSAVYARVPLPRTQTEIVKIDAFRVPEDVVAGMALLAADKDAEALNYQELSGKLTGNGDAERRLRAVYDSGARVAAAEATAYRRHCSCVYAVIVRAPSALLARVAARAGVRAVDAAPEVRRLDRAVFLPPLPEQMDVARPPTDDAIPEPDVGRPAAPGPGGEGD
jgi:hypothetical protein